MPIVDVEHIRKPPDALLKLPCNRHRYLIEKDETRYIPIPICIDSRITAEVRPTLQKVERYAVVNAGVHMNIGCGCTMFKREGEQPTKVIFFVVDEAITRHNGTGINVFFSQRRRQ